MSQLLFDVAVFLASWCIGDFVLAGLWWLWCVIKSH